MWRATLGGCPRPPRPATLSGPSPDPATPAPRAGSHRWVRAGGGGPACGHLAPTPPSAPCAPIAPRRPPGDAARRTPRAGPGAAGRLTGGSHPARPQRPAAERPRHRPPPSQVDDMSSSLNQRTTEMLLLLIAPLPDDAQVGRLNGHIAVGLKVATHVLDVEVHTWRVLHARRRRPRWQARAQARPPAPPSAPASYPARQPFRSPVVLTSSTNRWNAPPLTRPAPSPRPAPPLQPPSRSSPRRRRTSPMWRATLGGCPRPPRPATLPGPGPSPATGPAPTPPRPPALSTTRLPVVLT